MASPTSSLRPLSPSSGQNMDRPRAPKKSRWPIIIPVLGLLAIGAIFFLYSAWPSGTHLRVNHKQLTISQVKSGLFEDSLPLRGQVEPRRTMYLETIAGGQVEEVLVEDGAAVEKGQLLVVLSNSTVQLDVTSREVQVSEQLDAIRTLELQIQQTHLEYRRRLVEANYQIKRLQDQRARRTKLLGTGAVGKEELSLIENELQYWSNQKNLTKEAMGIERRLQQGQVSKLRGTVERLRSNLDVAKKNLDRLNVRAQISGKLTSLDVEVGQSLAPGSRIGQIDDPLNFKMSAAIDEFYLNRVEIKQKAEFKHNSKNYDLELTKIYPQVRNGEFEADFLFAKEQPQGIRKGQTLQFRLTLGEPRNRLLIPNGAFYLDTGGAWVFVLNEMENRATKRPVKLGRRNNRYIEIIEGLREGEKVIVSTYSNYLGMDYLVVNK